ISNLNTRSIFYKNIRRFFILTRVDFGKNYAGMVLKIARVLTTAAQPSRRVWRIFCECKMRDKDIFS
ncbi:MAG: hypothetical protein ACOCUV_02860, partial [bacterium]